MFTTTTDRPEQSSQRDAKGRFARNNDGGPGNPFGRRVAELRSIFLRPATDENVERLAQMLMEKAFAGDLAATKLLLLYWLGKPKNVAEPDRVDVEEWNLAREHFVPNETLQATFHQAPITVGILSLPFVAQARHHQMNDMFAHPELYRPGADDEPTPEELAEEQEMFREMRAAREVREAQAASAATSAATPAAPPSPAPQPSPRAAVAFTPQPQANEFFAPMPTNDNPAGSPSPIGASGGAPHRPAPASGRPRSPFDRAG